MHTPPAPDVLNNVNGTITGYEFVDNFKGKKKGEMIYFVPTIQVDGADEPIKLYLFLGSADRYVISEDSQSLTMIDDSPVTFGFSTPFGRFMQSMLDAAKRAGIDIESELPDLAEGEPLELSTIVNRRFRFVQEVSGKRTVKRKGKTFEYDRTETVIAAMLT